MKGRQGRGMQCHGEEVQQLDVIEATEAAKAAGRLLLGKSRIRVGFYQ